MIPDVATGGAPARAAERQKVGPGKYASAGTAGLKTMCGTRPSPHCAPNRLSSSVAARRGDQCRSPRAMKAESQLHWWG